MSTFDVKTAREKLEGVTPGPWEATRANYFGVNDNEQPIVVGGAAMSVAVMTASKGNDLAWPDAHFIAHARTDHPKALDEIERLQSIVDDDKLMSWYERAEDANELLRQALDEIERLRVEFKDLQTSHDKLHKLLSDRAAEYGGNLQALQAIAEAAKIAYLFLGVGYEDEYAAKRALKQALELRDMGRVSRVSDEGLSSEWLESLAKFFGYSSYEEMTIDRNDTPSRSYLGDILTKWDSDWRPANGR